MKNQKGFSLIELLIVVAIIGIIAAIAIPSLIRARAAANESAAIGTLRSIGSAQATYLSRNNNSSGDFDQLINGDYLDEAWNLGRNRNSYNFAQTGTFGTATGWGFTGSPDAVFTAGDRAFTISHDYVIRYFNGSTAPSVLTGTVLGASIS